MTKLYESRVTYDNIHSYTLNKSKAYNENYKEIKTTKSNLIEALLSSFTEIDYTKTELNKMKKDKLIKLLNIYIN